MDKHSEDAPLGFMFFWDESEWSSADKLSEEYRLALAAWNSGAECAREYHDKVLRAKAHIAELEAENQQIKDLLRRLYDNNEYDPGLWAEVADCLHLTPVSHEPR